MTNTATQQSYMPFRKIISQSPELSQLLELKPQRVIRDTVLLWLQIIAAWILVAFIPRWWTVTIAIPWIGTRYYALYIIGHDGLHRRLFRSVKLNDAWNDVLIIGAIGAITRLNRHNHMHHHNTLGLFSDPDRFKYVRVNEASLLNKFLGLTALPFVWRACKNVFAPRTPTLTPVVGEEYHGRDIVILLMWQGLLLTGLTWAIGWWAYPVLWLLPVYIFTFTADITRVLLEHECPKSDLNEDFISRMITHRSNFMGRAFFAPMNMNYHAAHHLWPSVPYYNLPQADVFLRQDLQCSSALEWRNSFLKSLILHLKRSKNGNPQTP